MAPRHGQLVDCGGWLSSGRFKRKRVYARLRGVILSLHKTEDSLPMSRTPVLGAEVQLYAEKCRITLPEFKLVLTASDSAGYTKWATAFSSASERRFETYYELGDFIGEGTFGLVRRGKCKQTGESVAVKIVPKAQLKTSDLKRLQTEALILTSTADPNIVQGYDVFDEEHQLVLVMELLSGGNLEDAVLRHSPLTEGQIISISNGILRALWSLHRMNIVHRDVKLENIMLKDKDFTKFCPKLIDFGFGTYIKENDENGKHLLKTILGSWFYVSPEQVNREAYGCPVDMWAFGVVLYWLVTEKFPFDGESCVEVMKMIRSDEIVYGEEWDRVNPHWKALCQGLLEKDPSKRLNVEEALSHAALHPKMELALVGQQPSSLRRPTDVLKTLKDIQSDQIGSWLCRTTAISHSSFLDEPDSMSEFSSSSSLQFGATSSDNNWIEERVQGIADKKWKPRKIGSKESVFSLVMPSLSDENVERVPSPFFKLRKHSKETNGISQGTGQKTKRDIKRGSPKQKRDVNVARISRVHMNDFETGEDREENWV